MKKILFLINNLGAGGAEKVLLTLVNRLCGEYKITVQTVYNEGIYKEQLDSRIQYQTSIKNPSLTKKRIMFRLLRFMPAKWLHKWLIRQKYDIEIAFLEGVCSRVISGAGDSAKTIAWIHTDITKLSGKDAGFIDTQDEKRSYAKFQQVVCVSEDAKQAFIKKIAPLKEPAVIYNPIDTENILLQANQPLPIDMSIQKFAFCAAGRMVSAKGFDRLLEAAARLIKENFVFSLYLIGDGEEKAALQKKIQEENLQNCVQLMGFLENPYAVMSTCDVFVCSSRYEGYSLVVAEALVLGVPVVSTECTGPTELLGYGKYGLLVENATEGIYEGMKKTLTNPALLTGYRMKAQERKEIFSMETTIAQVHTLLQE